MDSRPKHRRAGLSPAWPSFLLAGLVWLTASAGVAAVLRVTQDGSTPFNTLASALYLAQPGDTLSVGPGVYAESLVLDQNLTLIGDGADLAFLDGLQSRRILLIDGNIRCAISGFTLRNGYADRGGAIHTTNMAWLKMTGCVLEDNLATRRGGALYSGGPFAVLDLADCVFRDNGAWQNGGAIYADGYAWFQLQDCVLQGNVALEGGGAADSGYYAGLNARYCLFQDNVGGEAGALRLAGGFGTVENCTFFDNESGAGATVNLVRGSCSFVGNIVATDRAGSALKVAGPEMGHDCNLYYDFVGLVVLGDVLGPHEWVEDPRFCDHAAGDFGVCPLSRALLENNDCGPIGAYGLGCADCVGPVSVVDTSWGALRRRFR